MNSIEVKEVSEVIATLEVIDDTLAGDVSGRTNVVRSTSGRLQGKNSVNFDNFDNSPKNDNSSNF